MIYVGRMAGYVDSQHL